MKMVEVLKVVSRNKDEMLARCILGADDLSELESESLVIVGMPVGYELDFFSRCLDLNGQVAIYGTEGWNPVE